MVGAAGVWMISKCPPGWASDELKTKCENVPSKFSYPVEDFIPVIGVTGETYRNKHCAFCNGVASYTASDFEVNTFVIPPDEFDLDSKLKFIMDNGGGGYFVCSTWCRTTLEILFWTNLITDCFLTTNPSYTACVEGPVEVVGTRRLYFKNRACAKCNGYPKINSYALLKGCEGDGVPKSFSVVFDLRKPSKILTIIHLFLTALPVLFMIQP
jgi:hypothetical protein